VKGGCVPAGIPMLKSIEVEWRFSERKILYLNSNDMSVYIAHSAGPRSLMTINVHQVTAGKRLRSHNEQLMLIIPVVGLYNMQGYCDH
jgi:hypothetical protein